jgi:HlyD family secretion protein
MDAPEKHTDGKPRRPGRSWWVLVILLVGASAFPIVYAIRSQRQPPAAEAAAVQKRDPATAGVSCIGRIEPDGGVMHIAGVYISGRPPVVESLHIQEGQRVRTGTLLATLSGRSQLEAAVESAKEQIEIARRRLEQVKAGIKKPDLAAQEAEIARLEANLQNAQSELQRYETLRRTDDVTASELDARRTVVLTSRHAIEEAKDRLASMGEVRDTDVRVAEAQLQAAIADEAHARREYELTAISAPMDGQVLKVFAHPGEEIGPRGLLELGRTNKMYVVAEVYETDIGRVHKGQHATISGDLVGQELTGTVERVGMHVLAPSVGPGDPAAFSDNRIVEARILLDQGDRVAGLVDGRVMVVIHP